MGGSTACLRVQWELSLCTEVGWGGPGSQKMGEWKGLGWVAALRSSCMDYKSV